MDARDLLNSLPDVSKAIDPKMRLKLGEDLSASIEAMKRNPLKYGHKPHVGQLEVFEAETPLTLLIAANRWGKTEAGMRETLWRATMTHPYKENRPHNVIWVGGWTSGFYIETHLPKLLEWLPKDSLIEKNETFKWWKLRRADGGECTIFFKSFDQRREKWQGAKVDFIWLDEEMPEDIYREALARLMDSNGEMLMTLTPIKGMGWIYDRVYLPLQEGRMDGKLVQGALAEYDKAQPYGVGKPLVPHFTKEMIIRFAKSIPDEDERAIRVFGQYRARTGIVYKQFRKEIHLIDPFPIPEHWEKWAGVDSGYHGFTVIIFARSPDGHIYVVDEYFSQEEPVRVRAPRIWKKFERLLNPNKLPIFEDDAVLYVDTADPQMVMELNLWIQDRDVPIVVAALEQGKKAIEAGITRVQQLLDPDPDRPKPAYVARKPSKLGEPILYIFNDIRSEWRDNEETIRGCRLVWELTRYLWKEPPEGAPHPTEPNKYSAGGAHALDAFRYGVMARIGAPEEPKQDKLKHLDPRSRRVWEQIEAAAAELEDERWTVDG